MPAIVANDNNIKLILREYKPDIIATTFWRSTAQFEYHNAFDGLPVINLDLTKPSWYLWRNDYQQYIGKRLMLIDVNGRDLNEYVNVLNGYKEYDFVGLGNYKNLKYAIATGILNQNVININTNLMENRLAESS